MSIYVSVVVVIAVDVGYYYQVYSTDVLSLHLSVSKSV